MFINLNNLNLGKLQKNNKEDSTYNIIKKKRNLVGIVLWRCGARA